MVLSRAATSLARFAGCAKRGKTEADATMALMTRVALVWVAGIAAGTGYAYFKNIPAVVAIPVLLAFLVEITAYVEVRRLSQWPEHWILASALAPYLVYALGTGRLSLASLGLLAGLSAVAIFWLRFSGRAGFADVLFLAFLAGAYLLKPFRAIYPDPLPDLRVDSMGQLLWFRLGIASMLKFRSEPGVNFGFWPTSDEWRIGLRYFSYFMPVGVALLYGLRYAEFRVASGFWWKAPQTFLGILWVVALAEEFLFRGLLLRRFADRWGLVTGLVVSSIAFGLVHLWFREFPNWRHVAIATALGAFCGGAYLKAQGIRAAMVTHASVVTAWRIFFA